MAENRRRGPHISIFMQRMPIQGCYCDAPLLTPTRQETLEAVWAEAGSARLASPSGHANVVAPSYVCWFRFAPITIVIRAINHSYWSYKPS